MVDISAIGPKDLNIEYCLRHLFIIVTPVSPNCTVPAQIYLFTAGTCLWQPERVVPR